MDVEAFIEQWELANEMLDLLEGAEKDKTFDLMLEAAIVLGRAGYLLATDCHWYKQKTEDWYEAQ